MAYLAKISGRISCSFFHVQLHVAMGVEKLHLRHIDDVSLRVLKSRFMPMADLSRITQEMIFGRLDVVEDAAWDLALALGGHVLSDFQVYGGWGGRRRESK